MIRLTCTVCLLALLSGLATAAERESQDEIEEITVVAPRLERFQIPNVEFLIESYGNRLNGSRLYIEGKYEEAFPYLLSSAKEGFKLSQARLGYLYIAGWGTERDREQGLIWLGVAAKSDTAPEIRNYFKRIWKQLPEADLDYLQEQIDLHNAQYGALANRVTCDYSMTTQSRVKRLYCRYMDQCRFWHTEAVIELRDCPERFLGD